MELTENQKALILYSLEQQQIEFNDEELKDMELIIKKLESINTGCSLSILRTWKVEDKDIWLRVELATNQLIDNPNKTTKGWIKI